MSCSLRMSILISLFISSCLLAITVEAEEYDYGVPMPETGGQGVDEWYAEIEEERARVARQLDYPASNEEEIELRTSRANRTADSLSSIIGIYDDADEDDYIDQLPKNKSSNGGSSSSSSSESESDEKEKKGHLTAELHDDDQGFIHMDTGIQYDGEGRLGTAGHETYSEAHLNPDAVEDYHHSDNRHDSSSVDLIHSGSCKGFGETCSDNHVCCSQYCSWTRGFTCYSVPHKASYV